MKRLVRCNAKVKTPSNPRCGICYQPIDNYFDSQGNVIDDGTIVWDSYGDNPRHKYCNDDKLRRESLDRDYRKRTGNYRGIWGPSR